MNKIIKILSYILVLLGFLWVIGTIGADDRAVFQGTEVFTFEELVFRCCLGFGVSFVGLLAGRMVENG